MATLKLTTTEVLRALGLVMAVDRDAANWDETTQADARQIIRDGLRWVFNCGHEWRFLERPFVHAAPTDDGYATGTVAITGGVVTLTSGTFPTWAADGILNVDGHVLYVTERTSDTALTVSHNTLVVDAGTEYSLYRYRVALPDDFGEFIGGVTYQYAGRGKPLGGVNDNEIRLRYAAAFRTGETRSYATVPGTDDDASDNYFMFYPTMDADAVIIGTYRAVPADQLDDDDLTVDGALVQAGAVHGSTVLAAILSAAEHYYNDGPGAHSAKFQELLAKSIQHDKNMAGPVSPGNLTADQARQLALFYHVPTYN